MISRSEETPLVTQLTNHPGNTRAAELNTLFLIDNLGDQLENSQGKGEFPLRGAGTWCPALGSCLSRLLVSRASQLLGGVVVSRWLDMYYTLTSRGLTFPKLFWSAITLYVGLWDIM